MASLVYGCSSVIKLKFCTVEFLRDSVRTTFHDHTHTDARPVDNESTREAAVRFGYDGDILRYTQEHDFSLAFISQYLVNGTSDTLWCYAHNREPNRDGRLYEELFAQYIQRWARADERPLISGIDWDEMKRQYLLYVDGGVANVGRDQESDGLSEP